MLNYLWLGLLSLAILYGAWREVTNDPLQKTPDPKILEVIADAPEGVPSEKLSDSVTFSPSAFPVTIPLKIEVPFNSSRVDPEDKKSEKITVSGLALEYKTSYSDALRLTYQLKDADGDLFLLDGGKLEAPEDAADSLTNAVDLSKAVPSVENLAASLSYPVSVTGVTIRPVGESSNSEGTISLGTSAELTFAPIVYAEGTSWMAHLTESVTKWAETAITLAIGLIGIMTFWLGLMKIAEAAGLVQALANLMQPIMVFIFPNVDPKSEAMGAIVMNVAANMLGLGNAATPLGIKAMKELQKVNEYEDVASNSQCMLLAINTSSVTLIPISILTYRVATGSKDLLSFWPAMLVATCASTFFAILACKIFERMKVFAPPLDAKKKTLESTDSDKS
ncbi:MAG: nucleoside recognition domain-containing protein [Candidatus Sumerlaeia bacterium]|nr:nucleoside recognition domain-containing protein [Candidatus Sumerlaeia bacterium]